MLKRLKPLLAAAVLATPAFTAVASAAPPDQADAVQVMAQDVWVVYGTAFINAADFGSPLPPDAPLHNSVGLRLPAGAEDPLTWGEWSAATATSRVGTIGGPDYLTQGPDCRSSFGHDAMRHLLIYQKI